MWGLLFFDIVVAADHRIVEWLIAGEKSIELVSVNLRYGLGTIFLLCPEKS